MLVDPPPGTSDGHLRVVKDIVGCARAVLITTPEEFALQDVRREIDFCQKIFKPTTGRAKDWPRKLGWSCSAPFRLTRGWVKAPTTR
ncbi:hypothetical protein BJ322DRAFT_1058679 [Thelephora terrestris]|uniref:Uncharacterized protein n=1 Tax=Thelephora terrestris TaxID=56493 RepID=A0A9P6L831_9AGAM|nr:hypothetical protein BJ322DRAFT_1058679 [Thelephora terrestris]